MPADVPVAAKPTKSIFDPFNSSATGHQRADSRLAGSTSWRQSRNSKLNNQYSSGAGGGKRVSDTVGAGSLTFGEDGRTENGGWIRGAAGLRTGGQQSLWESMNVEKDVERPAKKSKMQMDDDGGRATLVVNPFTPFRNRDGTIRETSWTSHETRNDYEISPSNLLLPFDDDDVSIADSPRDKPDETNMEETSSNKLASVPQIFAGLTIYINGSTAPIISDHKLRHLLAEHGARTSIALGRRTVTHVIVGRPNSSGGCGGGLAGTKIHKEITKSRGKGVKYVTADWIVDSVKANKRLSESKYQGLNLAAKGVRSISSLFATANGPRDAELIEGDNG